MNMAVVTTRQMLESGVHFGHQTRRWNPKMKRFIFTERNGIYIIDLTQSLDYIDSAYEFVKETVAHGGSILFVGTKKQAQEAIEQQASRVGMPYVNHRWLGGMLTNFSTIHKRLQRLEELEQMDLDNPTAGGLTKKEMLSLKREKTKLERALGGIRTMAKVPSAVWVVDTNKEHIAVGEARKLGIPVVAVLDTNCDPDVVDYPVPGNDDAIRSVGLLTRVIADAVAEGLISRAMGDEAAEPTPEWEAEILAATDEAADTSGSSDSSATVADEADVAVEEIVASTDAQAVETPTDVIVEADAVVEPAEDVATDTVAAAEGDDADTEQK
jgi:small subunit ribosomal protein S2